MNMIEANDAGAQAGGPPMTAARLRDWARIAQPNARMIYGYGGVVAHACSVAVAEQVRTLTALGYVTSHRTKVDGRVVQLVQRTGKPCLKGAALEPAKEPKFRGSARSEADRLFGARNSRDLGS